MSNIHVNVGAPDEIPVPNTGAYTSISDTTTSGGNTFYIGVGAVIAIALVIILPVILVRKGVFKKPVSGFSLSAKKKLVPKILILALLSFSMTFSLLDIMKHATTGTSAARTRNITDTLTITAEDLNINIGIDDDPVYKSAASVITVETGTEAGYTLSAYASNPDFVAEENPENKISGLATSGLTNLGENTWGISLTAPESQNSGTWQAMPATEQNALVLKSTDEATTAGDQTTVFYGVYVNSDIPYGTYSGTINYVAVVNIVDPGFTVNFHGNGMYFDDEEIEDVNTVRYSKRCGPVYGYIGQPVVVKTPNIDDDGTKVMPYYDFDGYDYDAEDEYYQFYRESWGYYEKWTDFHGAKYLMIELTYDTDEHTEIEVLGNSISKRLNGANELVNTQFIISGDKATVSFYYSQDTDTEPVFDEDHNYGIYAKVYPIYEEELEGTSYQNNGEMCSWYVSGGQYKNLVDASNKLFQYWESDQDLYYVVYSVENNERLLYGLNSAGSDADSLIDKVIDLYANWKQVYQITYDANGGEGVMTQTHNDVAEGDWLVLYESGFSRAGYAFAGWNTKPDGTGENYGPKEAIFAPPYPESGHITLYARWIESEGAMQHWTGCDNLSSGDVIALTDNRDGRSYIVQRLLDGNCWMMENLDLGRTELITDLTSENTNLATTITASIFNSWKKTSGTATFDSGEFINLTGTDRTSGIAYGTLYNYYAATAGTIGGSANSSDASHDICPAGWRLPTGGSSGEFQALYNQYNSYNLMRTSIARGGIAFALTGYFSDGAPARLGDWGDYWSSTRNDDASTYTLFFRGSSVYPTDRSERNTASSIRCVVK